MKTWGCAARYPCRLVVPDFMAPITRNVGSVTEAPRQPNPSGRAEDGRNGAGDETGPPCCTASDHSTIRTMGAGSTTGRPIVIVGVSRRSGTNFVASVLLCHRDLPRPQLLRWPRITSCATHRCSNGTPAAPLAGGRDGGAIGRRHRWPSNDPSARA